MCSRRRPWRPRLSVERGARRRGVSTARGAIESEAETLEAVIAEMRASRVSERQGRLIDTDEPAAMERKKRDGYF